MKTHFLFSLLLLLCLKVSAQKQFVLSGKIKGAPSGTYIKLLYVDNNDRDVKDSALVVNDSFILKGNINEPTRAYLGIKNKFAEIFLEPAQLTANMNFADIEQLKLSGSKTNDENVVLKAQQEIVTRDFKVVVKKINDANKEFEQAKKDNRPEKVIDSLNEKLMAAKRERDPFVSKFEAVVREFVTTHPNSFLSPIQMGVYTHDWPLATVKTIYSGFSENVKNSRSGKSIAKSIIEIEKAVGGIAKDFSGVDLNGKALKLSDFKGKYVLIDFWGSWCVPCRAEMPHAKQIFAKYNSLGLEIIAIAAEDKDDDWRRAIRKDGTAIWHNMMQMDDKAGNPKNITGLYNIHEFPTKILIDKTGIIIAAYEGSGSEELDKKLAEIFKAG